MVDRINLILKAKNLTSRQFAEEIGIQPSGMSHILSGRNRPSLDFVLKVVSRYPEIDIKWLTLGEGEMYNTTAPLPKKENRNLDLFSSLDEEDPQVSYPDNENEGEETPSVQENNKSVLDNNQSVQENNNAGEILPGDLWENTPMSADRAETAERNKEVSPARPLPHSESNSIDRPEASANNQNNKRIVKVVILYNDHTFSEYRPE